MSNRNTEYPELWLDGNVGDRIRYLDHVLAEKALRQHKDYFNDQVRPIWLTHPPTKAYDEKQQK